MSIPQCVYGFDKVRDVGWCLAEIQACQSWLLIPDDSSCPQPVNFLFLNLAGLWALLALPVVVLIHLLRRRSRPLEVSTLFLLPKASAPSGGRRFAPLRQSLPLWLQLLAVTLVALALARPVIREKQPFGNLVVVLDQSASMIPFRQAAIDALAQLAARQKAAFKEVQWTLLDTGKNKLASGRSADDLVAKAGESWNPRSGARDPEPARRLARLLAGDSGTVVYVTDHPPAQKTTDWLSVGFPVPNAGFSGLKVNPDTLEWFALLRNYDTERRELKWTEYRGEGSGKTHSTQIDGGGGELLKGKLSSVDERVELRLEPDEFPLDDRLYIGVPRQKTLKLAVSGAEKFQSLFQKISEVLAPVQFSSLSDADFVLRTAPAGKLSDIPGSGMVFLEADGVPDSEWIVSDEDPFVEGLDWGGLRAPAAGGIARESQDHVLVWQGQAPLIFVRAKEGFSTLVWNFDVLDSNATRLPAFVILVYRFGTEVRNRLEDWEFRLVETGQHLNIAGLGARVSPSEPGFVDWDLPDGTPIFSAAANFADTREADFRKAAPHQLDANPTPERDSREGDIALAPWLLALLGLVILANWAILAPSSQGTPTAFRDGRFPLR